MGNDPYSGEYTTAGLTRAFEEDDRRLAERVAWQMSVAGVECGSREEAFYAAVEAVETETAEVNTSWVYYVAGKVSRRWARKGWRV